MEKVKVAVRVRPFNKREIDLNTKCVVRMKDGQTILDHTNDDKQPKTFAFDHSFYSTDAADPSFASQSEVFRHVGEGVLENAFAGYNACIFAYGQTGSGKSYSMMGTVEQPGIIPRLCGAVFDRIQETTSPGLAYKVEVSYMEIYNERVRDLLDPKKNGKHLKVREHKILGPMVDGLSQLAVDSYEQISQLIEEGNKSRTVAATNMNAESSRSHAVFNIRITQTLTDLENGFSGEKVSKISLVDLAGSERAQKSGAVGKRLEEGANINKSLTTLGMVISALAEGGKKDKFVPYRDSVLTWLLKDNLGGNSRTVMIATLSPSADNYEETLSTLRYADRAKRIVNHAVVNEDPNARVIRELREEVETLRMQISQTLKEQTETHELRERLAESERLVEQMNKSWEERLRETEQLKQERQKDLSEIGISIGDSGIRVEKDKFYLVNLNADPSLNELLVYYINSTVVIGSQEERQDDGSTSIVLQGLGVDSRHALLEISEEMGRHRLFITPLAGGEARTCVNGREIKERTLLRHGFRLLIGLNHFFRVNCPKEDNGMAASVMEESRIFDYDDAWHEVNADVNANPISNAVDQYMEQITLKHQEDKQAALEQQYEAFERYIQGLTAGGFTPSTPMTPGFGFGAMTPIGTPGSAAPPLPMNPRQTVRSKFFYWAQRREELFAESLNRLKNEIMRANALVREANLMAGELANGRRQTTYDLTLQIPAANLRPSKIKAGSLVCEPVIVVRRVGMSGCQLWPLAQLENKLVDMRDMYSDRINGIQRDSPLDTPSVECSPVKALPGGFEERPDGTAVIDPFFESQEHHSLIGVANVFLEVLFHDMKLDYHVPIISQQGEVAGKLHVELYRVPDGRGEEVDREGAESLLGRVITCRVRIRNADNLPSALSHFVFCQYSFFHLSEMLVVAPTFDPSLASDGQIQSTSFQFDHEKDFQVVVTEEFLEYCQEDALSIEVWGHRSCGFDEPRALDKEGKNKTLQDRWLEVSRKLSLWVEIKELNEQGVYAPVEVKPAADVPSGGVYQLKQGQQRRLCVGAEVVADRTAGNLPLQVDAVSSVSIGCVCLRNSENHRGLDSYQEDDLERMRHQWQHALEGRQKYLEQQLGKYSCSAGSRRSVDAEREHSLMEQWIGLTEERTAVSLPAPNTTIPGAPSDWDPPAGVERHVPVLFLDLNADDMTGEMTSDEACPRVPGQHSYLPKERYDRAPILLPVIEHDQVSTTCSWDSSLHDNQALNVPTAVNDRIYAVLTAVVRLSHPCPMEVVVRKRVALSIYTKPSLTERIRKKIVGESLWRTSVYYNVIAHIPKSSHDMEDRQSLAMLAARGASNDDENSATPRESYIEAYTKSIQAVESMLKLDRIRQEVAITNMLNRKQRHQQRVTHLGLPQLRMKRAVSLPNASLNSPMASLPPSLTRVGLDQASLAGSDGRRSLENSMTSSSNCSSMVTSLISPLNEKLTGIDEVEERVQARDSNVTECEERVQLSPIEADARNGNVMTSSSSTDEENRPDILHLAVNNNHGPGKTTGQRTKEQRKGHPFDLNITSM